MGFVSVGNYSMSVEQMRSLKTLLEQTKPEIIRRCDSSYADLEFEAFSVQHGCRCVQYVTNRMGNKPEPYVLDVLLFESPELAMEQLAQDSDRLVVTLPKRIDDAAAKISAALGRLDMGRTKPIHVIDYAGKVTMARKANTGV